MKLLEKITNLFMDEVDDDDEVELKEEENEEYKEPPKKVLPKIMRDTIEKEEKKEELPPLDLDKLSRTREIKEPVKEMAKEPTIADTPKKFNFPIDFDDEVKKAEIKEQIPQRRNIENITKKNNINHNVNVLNSEKEAIKRASELYPKKESNIKPKFKASPVISPVYGILDKNYTKEEVREKTDDNIAMKRPSKKVDFETVRKKAFGNLADEIKDNLLCENCELYKEVKKISSLKEDDLLYDMTVETDKEVTIEKAYDNYEEFGVAYEPKKEDEKKPDNNDENLVDIINDNMTEEVIDNNYKELDNIIKNNNDNNIVDSDKEEFHKIEDKIDDEVNDSKVLDEVEKEEKIPSRQKNKKEEKVDEDFFELIDSMYKERIDE